MIYVRVSACEENFHYEFWIAPVFLCNPFTGLKHVSMRASACRVLSVVGCVSCALAVMTGALLPRQNVKYI